MKRIIIMVVLALVCASEARADIKWVNSKSGGYYRDTSNDGNPYNNANYLGYNR